MRSAEIVVIDYGMGNLLSVQRGLEHVGAQVLVSADPERIRVAERVVLPGVGAFPDAMEELARRGLVSVIREIAGRGTPLLGICLGMQVLFETGAEFGETAGLSVLPGSVVAIPAEGADGQAHKIPHVGWNALYPSGGSRWEGGGALGQHSAPPWRSNGPADQLSGSLRAARLQLEMSGLGSPPRSLQSPHLLSPHHAQFPEAWDAVPRPPMHRPLRRGADLEGGGTVM